MSSPLSPLSLLIFFFFPFPQPLRRLVKEIMKLYYDSRESGGFNLCDVYATAYYLKNELALSTVDKFVCCETK